MKKSLLVSFWTLFVIGVLAVNIIIAQEKREAAAPSGFVLKVTYLKNAPSAFQNVSPKDAETKGAWYARFGRLADWLPANGQLPVRAVKITSRYENESAFRVNVSVFTGERLHEKEEFVATFLLRENETIVVKELKAFGVEPFEIAVVRLMPAAANLPTVENKTDSLPVIGIEPNYSTLPSFKVRIQNLSNKSVSAFTQEVQIAGRRMLSSMPQGREGRALIAPGAVYELILTGASRTIKTADGEKPEAQSNQTFVIRAVVFEDGTFEGDAIEAARFRGFTLGRKLQLEQIIERFNKALQGKENLLEQISAEISSLNVKPDQAAFDGLLKEFPDFTETERAGLQISVEVAMQSVKKDTLDEIALRLKSKTSDENAPRAWLNAMKERYQSWLARLH